MKTKMEYLIISVSGLLSLSVLIANGLLSISKIANVIALLFMFLCAYFSFEFLDDRTATAIALLGFSLAFFLMFLFDKKKHKIFPKEITKNEKQFNYSKMILF